MTHDDRYQDSGRDGGWGYWPLAGPFFAVLLVLTVAVLFVDLAGYASEKVGLSVGWFYAFLLGSLVGSRINIPVWRFPDKARVEATDVVVFGVRYRIPAVRHSGSTVLAVNVGGAIIPTALSVYLVVHDRIWQHSVIAIACVSVLVFLMARPVNGVGIVTPALLPPIVAASAAVIIGTPDEAALAYVCGTVGTLVGADLMNLPRIRALGAPEASIGGVGTFDGVFLTGLLAVVLASL